MGDDHKHEFLSLDGATTIAAPDTAVSPHAPASSNPAMSQPSPPSSAPSPAQQPSVDMSKPPLQPSSGASASLSTGAAMMQGNAQAYQKLKEERAKTERAKRKGKKKADPLDAQLTKIEAEQDDINKKYGEGSGAGMAILIVACLILLGICAYMFWLNGDTIIETLKTTPWFRYVFLAIAMYSYANSKY